MNIYGIIILCAILGEYVLHLLANYLNLSSLTKELPQEFRTIYDAEAYRKSQEYTRAQTRLDFITTTFDVLVLLGFWFGEGFNKLDIFVRGYGYSPIVTGLIYIGILLFFRTLLSLPFSIYSTFVIEERFGFNKTTPALFITDLLKGLALSLIIGTPVLAGVLWFFGQTDQFAWLYCWMAVTLIMIVLQWIAPTWIMPLFNTFTPLPDGELKTAILEYAKKVHFPLQGIFVIDGSKRSGKSNAFFTGFGKNKRIALFDTLVENHSVPELVAVLAHEIGHYKKKHIQKGILVSILHTGVFFLMLSIFLTHRGLFDAFFMEKPSIYAGLIFFGMLVAPVEMVLSMVMNSISRRHEFEADHFAACTTAHPEDMVNGLKKLSVDNLSNLTPHPFYTFLHYSHPPVLERIAAIRQA